MGIVGGCEGQGRVEAQSLGRCFAQHTHTPGCPPPWPRPHKHPGPHSCSVCCLIPPYMPSSPPALPPLPPSLPLRSPPPPPHIGISLALCVLADLGQIIHQLLGVGGGCTHLGSGGEWWGVGGRGAVAWGSMRASGLQYVCIRGCTCMCPYICRCTCTCNCMYVLVCKRMALCHGAYE